MTKAQHHHLQLIAEQVGGLGCGKVLGLTGWPLASQGLEATGQSAVKPDDPSAEAAAKKPEASEPKAQRPKGSKTQLPDGQEVEDENVTIKALRDTLSPKLMRREVRVKEAATL